MIIEHLGKKPHIHHQAWVAPDATVAGDVTIGAGSRILFGARIIAEDESIRIGKTTIVMENAVVRATPGHPCVIGNHVLIGPTSHVVGAVVEDNTFLATGTSIFHGSRVGRGSVVRVHGIVHVKSVLKPGSTVPIGWIACGDPAGLFSPDQHDALWAVQEPMKFALNAYGVDRPLTECMEQVTEILSGRLDPHRQDRIVPEQGQWNRDE